jgi:diguanylate cyclase (GGDEF)-like protein
MRLATITNWAYGLTVALTLASGTTMLLASGAQDAERAAVDQRYRLDQATSTLDTDVLGLTEQARTFVITGDPTHLALYAREVQALGSIEARLAHVHDVGATEDELQSLKQAMRWADALHDEQGDALNARRQGDLQRANAIMFGPEYAREIDRVAALVERFQYRLDQRTTNEVKAAGTTAKLWKMVSEATLGITGLLFLCVLFFVFRQRVLRPVVRLSDVVTRLAAQDYAVEPPDIDQIDEIGDMAHALGIFRENGLARQKLEAERDADRSMRDLLARMTQRMHGSETLLDFEDVIKRFVPEIAPALAGRLYLLDAERNELVEMCNWNEPVHSRTSFSPLSCWALRRGTPHRPAGSGIDVPCDHLDLRGATLIDSVCMPLSAHREAIGLLYFEPRADANQGRVTPDNVLQMLAENIALSIANLRLRERLSDLAMADALTGLANRRQLDEVLETQVADAERLNQPLTCLMIDVDHFKRFNDEHGHEAGDAVLRAVGGALRSLTRENGFAFRYGGEEFTLLMPGLDSHHARARAEEIRMRIAELTVLHEGRSLGAVTASIGLACAPHHCPPARIVQAADAALLRAKAGGRNRVEMAVRRGSQRAA